MPGAFEAEKDKSPCPKITPEMEIAGARVLLGHYPEETGPLESQTGVAVEVFEAMCRAKREPSCEGGGPSRRGA